MLSTFGERIAYLRNRKGWSQEETAKRLNIGKSTLGMYETDKRKPSHEVTAKFSELFEMSIDWLTTGKESQLPINNNVFVLNEFVERYNIELGDPHKRDQFEKLIQIVFQQPRTKE